MIEPTSNTVPVELFEQHRSQLKALAYRLLGTVSDAEDIVQDTYVRWMAVDHARVNQPGAFLSRIATRLCLDHLKSARVRRETYVGQWLPEPVVHAAGLTEMQGGDLAEDISYALMLALERLSPLERAAFLLHDVFGMPFEEIAETLERSAATCRQLAARARTNVRAARPRFSVASAESGRITEVFMRAAQSGDVSGLRRVLAADAVLRTDGGGKVRAVLRPIVGGERIVRLVAGLARRGWLRGAFIATQINGLPGFVIRNSAGITDTYAFEIRDRLIHAVYIVRNPDKLRHLRRAGIEQNN